MEDSEPEQNFLGEDERKNGVTYTDYVDLLPFAEGSIEEHFEEALRYSSSDDWKEQFFSTDLYRRINKYDPTLFEQKAMEIFPFLDYWINSPRTCLGKNVLVLCQEVYMQTRPEKLIEFTWNVLPILVTKVGFESKFLSTESQFALQFWAASMAYPECINILWSLADYKNSFIKSQVWKALTISIQNLDPKYFEIEIETPGPHCLELLFDTIWTALLVPKSTEGRESIKILNFITKDTVRSIWEHIFSEENSHKTDRIMGVFTKKKKRTRLNKKMFKNFQNLKGKSNTKDNFVVCIK